MPRKYQTESLPKQTNKSPKRFLFKLQNAKDEDEVFKEPSELELRDTLPIEREPFTEEFLETT